MTNNNPICETWYFVPFEMPSVLFCPTKVEKVTHCYVWIGEGGGYRASRIAEDSGYFPSKKEGAEAYKEHHERKAEELAREVAKHAQMVERAVSTLALLEEQAEADQ